MASWILVPCLVSLRDEFNALAPARDKTTDGSIGDTSHSAGASDHNPDETGRTSTKDADKINEVHAIDVDHDLRKSGTNMQQQVDIIVGNHRAGRDDRLQYVIYNRKIASASWGWTWRDYTGASPHTEHAHFSARYTTAQESDKSPWGLKVPVTTPPGGKPSFMKFTVTVPVLKQGDRDDKLEGYNMVARIQKLVGAKADGIWGDETTTKIAAWCKIDKSKAKVMTEQIYRNLFGLAH